MESKVQQQRQGQVSAAQQGQVSAAQQGQVFSFAYIETNNIRAKEKT